MRMERVAQHYFRNVDCNATDKTAALVVMSHALIKDDSLSGNFLLYLITFETSVYMQESMPVKAYTQRVLYE